MPSQPIAAKCPLCHDHRHYLPPEVFLGRLSHRMIRKPVSTADGRAGSSHRGKEKPNFDFSLPCPLCGYKIQPNELMRLASYWRRVYPHSS